MDKETAIAMACRDNNYKWPSDLWTGVMFYCGYKITIREFNNFAKNFNGG